MLDFFPLSPHSRSNDEGIPFNLSPLVSYRWSMERRSDLAKPRYSSLTQHQRHHIALLSPIKSSGSQNVSEKGNPLLHLYIPPRSRVSLLLGTPALVFIHFRWYTQNLPSYGDLAPGDCLSGEATPGYYFYPGVLYSFNYLLSSSFSPSCSLP